MKAKPGLTLRNRVLLLLALAVLPGLIVAVTDTFRMTGVQESNAKHSLKRLLTRSRHDYADAVDDMVTDTRLLVRSVSTAGADCPDTIEELSHLNPGYALVALVTKDGTPVCLSARGLEAKKWLLAMHHTIDTLAGDRGAANSALIAAHHGYPMMLVVARVAATHKSRPLVAVIGMPYSPISRLGDLPFMGRISMKLRDYTGRSVHLDETRGAGVPSAATSAPPNALAQGDLAILNGSASIVATLRLVHLGEPSLLRIELPKSALYKTAYSSLRHHLLMLLAALIVLAIMAISAADRMIVAPASAIMRVITRLAQGDLSARTGLSKGYGDMSKVACSLDRMAETFEQDTKRRQEMMARLERANRLYKLLAAIDTAIDAAVDSHVDERSFLEQICQLATSIGGFRFAYVGDFDIREGIPRLLADISSAPGPNDEAPDPAFGFYPDPTTLRAAITWSMATRDRTRTAAEAVAQSVAALPMGHSPSGKRRLLTLTCAEIHGFPPQEASLLTQVAQSMMLGTQLIRTESALQHAQTHDVGTGLVNETHLHQRLGAMLEHAEGNDLFFGLCLIDTGFGLVVQRQGLSTAKLALRSAIEKIRGHVDEENIAILPGPIFGIIVDFGLDRKTIEHCAEKLYSDFCGSFEPDRLCNTRIPLRFGVSIYPDGGNTPERLLETAQIALHHVGDEQKQQTFTYYSESVGRTSRERRDIEARMGDALEEGLMSLFYQPIVGTVDGHLVGFEALLRWEDPQLGMVEPSRFIPIAETSGLIFTLGQQVLRKSCRQAVEWSGRYPSLPFISVNVSPLQLADRSFITMARRVVRETGYEQSRARVALEITENDLIADLSHGLDVLTELRELGFDIFIDDFGTGYSSLSYLHRLPIDALKIDKSITRAFGGDGRAEAVCAGIVAIAHNLKVRTIAEGIESTSQHTVIQQLNCDLAQGFMFGKACPPAEAGGLIDAQFDLL